MSYFLGTFGYMLFNISGAFIGDIGSHFHGAAKKLQLNGSSAMDTIKNGKYFINPGTFTIDEEYNSIVC